MVLALASVTLMIASNLLMFFYNRKNVIKTFSNNYITFCPDFGVFTLPYVTYIVFQLMLKKYSTKLRKCTTAKQKYVFIIIFCSYRRLLVLRPLQQDTLNMQPTSPERFWSSSRVGLELITNRKH